MKAPLAKKVGSGVGAPGGGNCFEPEPEPEPDFRIGPFDYDAEDLDEEFRP
jgi:hypothetical protein